jgi:hypothetical protein
MTLHDFLIFWAWLSHQLCITRTNLGLGPVIYGGACTEAIRVAHAVSGAWFFWPVH